jgi:hypothetical protein
MNIFSFTGSNIGSIGLDRDEGLPAEQGLRGSIVSLVPELNGMYALVQGDPSGSVVVDVLVDSSVHVWTGYGWHAVWESGDPVDVTRLYVSGARSQHRLWWGSYNGSTYSSQTIILPIAQTNARQLQLWAGDIDYDEDAYIQTGLTDFGMPGAEKIGASVGLRACGNNGFAIPYPVVRYRTSEYGSWTTCVAGEVTYFYWMDSAFEGIRFDEIELEVSWDSPAYVKWMALYFTKLISGNRAWTVTLDLTEKFEDNSPEVMDAALDAFILDENIIDFIYRDTTYKVRVTSWSGADSSGRADTRGMRSVQLLEVHDRP